MKNTESKTENKPVVYQELTTLLDLEAASSPPVVAEFYVKAKPFKMIGRRLRPEETRLVRDLLDKAMPPLTAATAPDGEERYDFRNPDYQKQKEDHRRQARAFVLVTAFPQFTEAFEEFAKNNPPQHVFELAARFVESRRLDENVLDYLMGQVVENVLGIDAERAKALGFTSAASSPAS